MSRLDGTTLGFVVVGLHGLLLGAFAFDCWHALSYRVRKLCRSVHLGENFTIISQLAAFGIYVLLILASIKLLFWMLAIDTQESWRLHGRIGLVAMSVGIGCRVVVGNARKGG